MSKNGRDIETEMVKMLARYDEGLKNDNEDENLLED